MGQNVPETRRRRRYATGEGLTVAYQQMRGLGSPGAAEQQLHRLRERMQTLMHAYRMHDPAGGRALLQELIAILDAEVMPLTDDLMRQAQEADALEDLREHAYLRVRDPESRERWRLALVQEIEHASRLLRALTQEARR